MKNNVIPFLILCFIQSITLSYAQTGSSCADPFVISSLPFTQTGLNTSSTADNYDSGPCTASNTYMAGNDFIFSYTPVSNETVNISLSNVSTLLGSGIFVTDSCPDNSNAACIAEASGFTAPSITNLNLIAGTQYYFIISSRVLLGQGQTTGFDITVQTCGSAPTADFSYSQSGLNVIFTNTSTNGETYQWLFGDEIIHNWFFAANDTNPIHTYGGYGTYTVEMVSTNSCGSTDTVSYTITLVCPGPVPAASFVYSADNTTVTFTNTSSNAATSSWLFGDEGLFPTGDTATNPVHFYNQAGTYTVELTITTDSGCQSVFTDTITISCDIVNTPVADFSYSTIDSTVIFTNLSTDATNYTWLFGDEPFFPPASGDTTANPVHTYNGWGTYNVQLTASNCFASTTITIPILICNTSTVPVADFTTQQSGMTVSFTNISTDSNTYEWLFGDEAFHNWFLAANDTNPVHTYSSYGTYTVEMVATNICGVTDTIVTVITLSCPGPVPTASFTYVVNNTEVTFTNTSSNAASSSWLFGDEPIFPFPTGDNTVNPVHTYAQAGTYTVQLTITSDSGCQSVFTDTIIVSCNITSVPVASFDYIINDTIVTFTNTSTDGSTYQWLFGDEIAPLWMLATNGADQVHSYAGAGTYTVQMIASNCFSSDTIVFDIILCSMPDASFTHAVSGMNVSFQSTATNTISHQWFFGDETNNLPSDTTANPSHTYVHYGSYVVTYVAINECGTDTQKINISILCPEGVPNASFTFVNNQGTVSFTNTSTGNNLSYVWFFGDEADPNIPSDLIANPTHIYSQAGTYTVRMIVSNNCGTDTIITTISIVGIEQINNTITIQCYPNPVSDVLYIKISDMAGQTIQVSVQNIIGTEIYSETFFATNNDFQKQLKLQNLAGGIYLIRVNSNNRSAVTRVISE